VVRYLRSAIRAVKFIILMVILIVIPLKVPISGLESKKIVKCGLR
jgi:hypothetical protein